MAIGTPADMGTLAHTANVNTETITLTAGANVGDKVEVITVAEANTTTTVSSVVDSKGNTYTFGVKSAVFGDTEMWFADVSSALSAADTITVHWSSTANNNRGIAVSSISGCSPGSPPQTATFTNTSVTGWKGGTVVVADANAIVRGAATTKSTSVTSSTPGAGFTELHDFLAGGTSRPLTDVYQQETTTGTYIPIGTFNASVGANGFDGIAWTWKPTTGTAPVNTGTPAITGNLWAGQTLFVSTGSWTGDVSSGYLYQWKDGTGIIVGATSSSYVIASGEASRSITCTVTARGTGGSTAADSNTVGPIGFLYSPTVNDGHLDICANSATGTVYTAGAPLNTVPPVVSGLPRSGSLLSCTTGTWTGSPAFSYQWMDGTTPIVGAVFSTYVSQDTDVAAQVTCVVTGTNVTGILSVFASNSITVTGASPGPFTSNPHLAVFGTPAPHLASVSSSNPHLAVFN